MVQGTPQFTPAQVLEAGRRPACVEMCPPEALLFGKREDLLELAKQRIQMNPDRYYAHIYGEHEVGGTSWLYLTDRDYRELGLHELATDPPSAITEKPSEKTRRWPSFGSSSG